MGYRFCRIKTGQNPEAALSPLQLWHSGKVSFGQKTLTALSLTYCSLYIQGSNGVFIWGGEVEGKKIEKVTKTSLVSNSMSMYLEGAYGSASLTSLQRSVEVSGGHHGS